MKSESEDTLDEELQQIANHEKVLILSFVAPDRSVKVSPIGVIYVSIDIDDLYEIEKVIEQLEEKNELPQKLHLVIQTPGGLVHVSTKIANYLRRTFHEIHAFVPYEASSGGTILCLAANKITMGKMANLTPIDPQMPYDGTRVSTASYQRTVNSFEQRFGKKRPAEIPPPYQQMCEKLDPVILTELNKVWQDAALVACSLLEKSYKPNDEDMESLIDTAHSLAFSSSPHGHMIDAEEAESIGLRIDSSEESRILLQTYKKWVKSMLGEEQVSHVIKHFYPEGGVNEQSEQLANKKKAPKSKEAITANSDAVNNE